MHGKPGRYFDLGEAEKRKRREKFSCERTRARSAASVQGNRRSKPAVRILEVIADCSLDSPGIGE